MAKKEKNRNDLKKKLRGQLKAIAQIANRHYQTVREYVNYYVETGEWKSIIVRDAVQKHLESMKKEKEALDAQLKELV
jgi:hypothetical protein